MTNDYTDIARTFDREVMHAGDRETQRLEDSPRAQVEQFDGLRALTLSWMAKIERGEITEYDRANWPPRWVR